MKEMCYLLYEGNQWLETRSLVLRGVFSNTGDLSVCVKDLITDLAKENYIPEKYSSGFTKEDFVEQEYYDFLESWQTFTGSRRLICESRIMNQIKKE